MQQLIRSMAALLLSGALAVGVGCQSAPKETGLSPQEITEQNLRNSIASIRQILKLSNEKRDRFQEKFLSAAGELEARGEDVESLQAFARVQLAENNRLQADSKQNKMLADSQAEELKKEKALSQSQHERVTRLKKRATQLEAERQQLVTQAKKSAAEKQQQLVQLEALQKDIAKLRGLAAMERTGHEGDVGAREQEISSLKSQLKRSKAELVAANNKLSLQKKLTEQAQIDYRKSDGQLEVAKGKKEESKLPNSSEPFALIQQWGIDSYLELKEGKTSQSNLLAAGIAVVALLGSFMLLIFAWRSRRLRKQNRLLLTQLQDGAAQAAPQPAAQQQAAPVVQKATQDMSAIAPPQIRPAARRVEQQPIEQAPVSPLDVVLPEPAVTQNIRMDSMDGLDGDGCAITQEISTALEDSLSPGKAQSVSGAPASAGARSDADPDEDELLSDLRSVIQGKFTNADD